MKCRHSGRFARFSACSQQAVSHQHVTQNHKSTAAYKKLGEAPKASGNAAVLSGHRQANVASESVPPARGPRLSGAVCLREHVEKGRINFSLKLLNDKIH